MSKPERRRELMCWGLGVTLCVHLVSWLGVSYFDQSWVVWLMHLAAVSASLRAIRVPESRAITGPLDAVRGAGQPFTC